MSCDGPKRLLRWIVVTPDVHRVHHSMDSEESSSNFGFNAQTEEFGDLVQQGVIDPTKVTRTALQNAASVAGLMLTTDAMVAELVEEKKGGAGHSHGMPGMGGMGDMDM